jgi:hypothetical protein
MPGVMSSLSLTRSWFFGFPHGGANGLRLTVPERQNPRLNATCAPFPCPTRTYRPGKPTCISPSLPPFNPFPIDW